MICCICGQEILGAYIYDVSKNLARHIKCIPEIVKANVVDVTTSLVGNREVEKVDCSDMSADDIINKFTTGETNV